MISTEEGQEIADQNGMLFYETSAKAGTGIKEAFEAIARDIINQLDSKAISGVSPAAGSKASNFSK